MKAAPFLITPGQRFRLDRQKVEFKRCVTKSETVYIFENTDKRPVEILHDKLVELRVSGRLVDEIAYQERLAAAQAEGRTPIGWARADGRDEEEGLRRMDYVLAWRAAKMPSRTVQNLGSLIENVFERRRAKGGGSLAGETPPSVRTVQEWLRRYLDAGENAAAVVPQHKNKGCRQPRLVSSVKDIIDDVVDLYYLTRRGCSMRSVHDRVSKQIDAENELRAPEAKLSKPSYETIRQHIERLCPYTVAYCRKGRGYAREKYRVAGGGIVTTHANEVWEIDDTRIDLICTDDESGLVIGRPWLILVIDRHTRMIMGFALSFAAPDSDAVMEVLREAILPKDPILQAAGIEGSWAACNKPTTICVDNGKAYNSSALKRGLAKLGIGLQNAPVLKAWYKGIVERCFGTLTRQVFHVLPGTTYSSIYERDDDPAPEMVAETGLREAQDKILRWITLEYQHTHHKGIDDTPAKMWAKSLHTHPQGLLPSREDVEVALSLTVERTLRKDGIEIDGLRYVSQDVARVRMVPRLIRDPKVIVRRDPNNLFVIEFLDAVSEPGHERWRKAFLIEKHHSRVEGKTLAAFRVARALRNANPDQFGDDDPTWQKTYKAIERDAEDGLRAKRLNDRRRAVVDKGRLLLEMAKRTEPKTEAQLPVPGEDLITILEAGLSVHPNARPAATDAIPSAAAEPTIDPAAYAARHGLVARVRRKPTNNP